MTGAIVLGLVRGFAIAWVIASFLWLINTYDPDPRQRPPAWPYGAVFVPAALLYLLGAMLWALLMWGVSALLRRE